MLTMYDDDATVLTAMQAGARGYLLKGAEQDEIVGAIRAVVAGQVIFGPASPGGCSTTSPPRPSACAEPFPQLTAREREILDLLADGRRTVGHRRGAVPVTQDRQQQPDQHLRQARGRRPGGSDHPRPRGWARERPVTTAIAKPSGRARARRTVVVVSGVALLVVRGSGCRRTAVAGRRRRDGRCVLGGTGHADAAWFALVDGGGLLAAARPHGVPAAGLAPPGRLRRAGDDRRLRSAGVAAVGERRRRSARWGWHRASP